MKVSSIPGRRLAVAAVIGLSFLGSAANAAPLILASIKADCQVSSDGAVTTVKVDLNGVTHNFYGAGLYYHFSNGTVVQGANVLSPRFNLPAGTHSLRITTKATAYVAGDSSSPVYSLTVPAYQVINLKGRKMCAKRAELNPRDKGILNPNIVGPTSTDKPATNPGN